MWFKSTYWKILNSPFCSYDSRINSNGSAPWRIQFREIPAHAMKHASNKLYMTPSVFKDKEACSGSGMGHEDILFDPVRVIDIDRPHGALPVSVGQVEFLANLLPGSAILKSNGVQIFLHSSESWEVEAPMLAQIGRHLENLVSPLFYDASCHLRQDGSAGNHRNHAYRCPWGSCDSGPVRCWLPENGQLATVRGIFNLLGLVLSAPKRDVGIVGVFGTSGIHEELSATTGIRKTSTNPTIPRVPPVPRDPQVPPRKISSKRGSFSANYQEFEEIRQLLGDLLKQGQPRQAAESQIAAMPWKHHSRRHLEKTLPTVCPKGASDGLWLSSEAWAGVCADLKELPFRLGPCSKKRRFFQKTRTVRATRAWAFEFLFYYGLTVEEAIAAFLSWLEFQKIRQLSVSAIGHDAVVEDLRRCWEKFNSPGYSEDPYSTLPKVSRQTLALVRQRSGELGEHGAFKLADLRKGLSLSATQVRAALKELAGEIVASGTNKGRVYRLKGEGHMAKRLSVGTGGGKTNSTGEFAPLCL